MLAIIAFPYTALKHVFSATMQSATKLITILNHRKWFLWGLRPQERSLENPKSFPLPTSLLPLTAGKWREMLTIPLEEARSTCHKPWYSWYFIAGGNMKTVAHLHKKRQKLSVLVGSPSSTNGMLSTSTWANTAFCRAPTNSAEPAWICFIFLFVAVCK